MWCLPLHDQQCMLACDAWWSLWCPVGFSKQQNITKSLLQSWVTIQNFSSQLSKIFVRYMRFLSHIFISFLRYFVPRYWTKEHDGGLVLQHASAAHPHHDAPHCHCLDHSLQVMWEEDGNMINDSDVCRTTTRKIRRSNNLRKHTDIWGNKMYTPVNYYFATA